MVDPTAPRPSTRPPARPAEPASATSVGRLADRSSSADLVRWMLIPGSLCVLLGFVAIGLGWYGAAHTAREIEQIPYLISGGVARPRPRACSAACSSCRPSGWRSCASSSRRPRTAPPPRSPTSATVSPRSSPPAAPAAARLTPRVNGFRSGEAESTVPHAELIHSAAAGGTY